MNFEMSVKPVYRCGFCAKEFDDAKLEIELAKLEISDENSDSVIDGAAAGASAGNSKQDLVYKIANESKCEEEKENFKKTDDKLVCEKCGLVLYCDKNCQEQDRDNHRRCCDDFQDHFKDWECYKGDYYSQRGKIDEFGRKFIFNNWCL